MSHNDPLPLDGAEDVTLPPQAALRSEANPTPALSENETINFVERAQQLPRQFGDYLLLQEIARGGMGVVYKARQQRLNRIVAVKMILSGQFAGEEDVQRFYAEAESAANLNHPGIVPIFEVGQLNGQHFFSMGFVDGPSLAQLLLERPVAPQDAALLTRQTAEAIDYAHARGVIHRDLKPANVLLARDEGSSVSQVKSLQSSSLGQPKVTDFGLAKQLANKSELTATGQILGTPGYMPPEQAAGKTDQIGPLADVYSLGGILYALLTGRAPFQAASPLDTLLQVIESEPVPPRQLNSQVPADLETICLKCLQKDSQRRYQSAADLVDDLNRFLDGSPITARPVTTTERAWRWAKKHPAVALLSFTSLALLLVIAVAAPIIAFRQSQLRAAESIAKQNAIIISEQLEVAKGDAEADHYSASISLAYAQWAQGSLSRARQLLNEAPAEFRDWEWSFLDHLCSQTSRPLYGHAATCPETRFDRFGQLLATTMLGKAKVWDVASGFAREELQLGSVLGSFDRYAARVVHWTGSEAIACTLPPLKVVHAFSQSDVPIALCQQALDAPQFAVLRKNDSAAPDSSANFWSIEIANPESGKIETTLRNVPPSLNPLLAFSPSANCLAYAYEANKILYATSAQQWRFLQIPLGNFQATQLAFSPQNADPDSHQFLAVACTDGLIRIYRCSDSNSLPQLTQTLATTGAQITALSWDATGKWLAAGSNDRLVSVWLNLQPNSHITLRGVEERINSLAFDSDSKQIAAATDFGVRLWNLPQQDSSVEPARFVDARQDCLLIPISVSPLQQLVVAADERTCWVIDATNRIFQLDIQTMKVNELPIRPWLSGQTEASRLQPPAHDLAFQSQIQVSRDSRTLAFTLTRLVDSDTLEKPVSVRSSVVLWDLISNAPLRILGEHDNMVNCLLFGPEDRSLVVGTGLQDDSRKTVQRLSRTGGRIEERQNVLQVWDVRTGLVETTLHQQSEDYTTLAFSPDFRHLVAAGRMPLIDRWDWQSKTLLTQMQSPAAIAPQEIAWANLPERIASDVNATNIVSSEAEPNETAELIESLVVAGTDGRIRIYDANNGRVLRILEGHANRVNSVLAFQPSRIASSSDDSTLRVWDPVFGTELISLPHNGRAVSDIGWLPTQNTLLSITTAGQLHAWQADISPLQQSDSWQELKIGQDPSQPSWKPIGGKWNFTADSMEAETELVGQVDGLGELAIARATLNNLSLPDTLLLEFEVTLPVETCLQVMLDNAAYDGEMIELATALNPFTQRRGSSISRRAGVQDFREAVANPTLQLTHGVPQKVRIWKTPDSISVEINNQQSLRCRLSTSLDNGLMLQAIYGIPGGIVQFKNLRIRAPQPAIERHAVWLQLKQWLADELLVENVIQKIDQNEKWSLELRRYAKLRVAGLQENSEAMSDKVNRWLDEGNLSTPQLKSQAVSLAKRAIALEDRWQDWLLLAEAYAANGDHAQALPALKSAFEKCQLRRGAIAPAIWGWLAVCNHQLDRASAAATALQKANRAAQLSQDTYAWQRTALVLQRTFGDRWQDNGLDQVQNELLAGLLANPFDVNQWYASSFTFRILRADQANSVITTLNRDQWLQLGEFLASPGIIGFHDLSMNDVQFESRGDQAVVRFDAYQDETLSANTLSRHSGWQRQQITLDLVRSPAGAWQIVRHTVKPQASLSFSKSVPLDAQRLADLDATLDKLLPPSANLSDGELRQLALDLRAALRVSDALAATQLLTARPSARASDWVLQSALAFTLGNVNLSRQAAERAIAIQPTIDGPLYVRTLSRAIRGENSWVSIGRGFQAQIPSEWKLMGSDAFVGAEGFQIGWIVEAPQAVLSTRLAIGSMSADQFLQQMQQANEQMKRNVLRQERLKTIPGTKDAVWLEFEGLGNGGMIDGRGTVPSHQVMVFLFLDNDILLVTAVSPERTWEPLGKAFAQMVNSIRPE